MVFLRSRSISVLFIILTSVNVPAGIRGEPQGAQEDANAHTERKGEGEL